ncbi:MAG: ATPase, partial [Herminiimonas sp.]|nr:ATPase [Herminiimonas sp.]
LLSLINDMLDLAKIESGKFELNRERVICQGVIDNVMQTLGPSGQQKGLVLDVDMPAQAINVIADQRALTQILLNLVNNAIKFTEAGRVDVRLARRVVDGSEQVHISVCDTGIGIRAEDRGKLFQTFTQVDATLARPFEGTGLGLYLSQKLAHLMAGEISCDSEYGKGSCFTLVLHGAPLQCLRDQRADASIPLPGR